MEQFDVVIIGGGVCGLSASIEVRRLGKSVLILEKDNYVGGILKQCIHEGFGLIKFRENLTGPEYLEKLIEDSERLGVEIRTKAFVTSIEKSTSFVIKYIDSKGVNTIRANAVILSTGARERTAKQFFLQGDRPSGIFTAGETQYYVNVLGKMPTKKCVVLGSGDIGLIMARRLTIEGSKVLCVLEKESTPVGLARNIQKCLDDYDIPLMLNHTITRVIGRGRVESVEIAKVVNGEIDEASKRIVECDAVILSVGLIPEIGLIENFGLTLDEKTLSAAVDQTMMTSVDGLFVCGNALHNNDFADYVSETGETAGKNAALYKYHPTNEVENIAGDNILYVIPQKIDLTRTHDRVICYFKTTKQMKDMTLKVHNNGKLITCKQYKNVPSSGLLRVMVDFATVEDKEVVFTVGEN